jgi:hypothetical protein
MRQREGRKGDREKERERRIGKAAIEKGYS